jgi:hypothetical protein
MACGFTMIGAARKGQSNGERNRFFARNRQASASAGLTITRSRNRELFSEVPQTKPLLTKPAHFRDAVSRDPARAKNGARSVPSPAQAFALDAVRLTREWFGVRNEARQRINGEPKASKEAQKRRNWRAGWFDGRAGHGIMDCELAWPLPTRRLAVCIF